MILKPSKASIWHPIYLKQVKDCVSFTDFETEIIKKQKHNFDCSSLVNEISFAKTARFTRSTSICDNSTFSVNHFTGNFFSMIKNAFLDQWSFFQLKNFMSFMMI